MTQWLISSSVLILAVAALRYALRGRISLRLQYALWALVLLRLLVPLSFGESAVSVMNAAERLPLVGDSQRVSGMDTIKYDASGTVSGYYASDYMNDFPTVIASDQSRQDFARMEGVLDFRRLFVRVWITGAFLLALVFLASNFGFMRRLRQSRVYHEVKGGLLPVYAARGLPSPCLYGLLRPAIYVTPELLKDEDRLRHVLAHETTHYRHGDNLWSLLRCLCLCVHWFNPLVWLAASLSRRDAELACDEGTIARLGEQARSEYGRTLIDLSCKKHRAGALFLTGTAMLGGKRGLRERITLLTKKPKTVLWALAAVLFAATLAAGCAFTGAQKAAEEPVPLTAEQRALLKDIDWWQYRADNGGEALMARIGELLEAVEAAPQISEDDCALLMEATPGLYGAYAHAYGGVVLELYRRHEDVFDKCFPELNFQQRAKVTELRLSADAQLDTAPLGFENIVFDDAELDAAFACARAAFDGKTRRLENLWYSHYRCASIRESYLRDGRGRVSGVKPENVLVLLCDYTLLEAPGQAEQFFTDWMLILIRDDKNTPWRIDDQGY